MTEITKEKKKGKLIIIITLIAIAVIGLALFLILVVFGSDKKEVRKYLDLGDRYLTDMDYENAILAYTKVVEIDPSNPEGYIGLAEVCIRMGEFEEAREWAQKGYDNTGDERLKAIIDMIDSGNIFDSDGRQMRMTGYDGEHNLLFWHVFTYDKEGNPNSVTAFDKTGKQIGYLDLYRNENEQVWYGYGINGEISKDITEYENGKRKRRTQYNEQGEVSNYTEYEQIGDTEIETSYNHDDIPYYRREMTHTKNGFTSRIYDYINGKFELTKTEVQEGKRRDIYDADGNLIEYYIFEDKGGRKEYDADGNLKFEVSYD